MCVHRGACNVHKCAKVCAHIARELVPPLIRHLAISRHQGWPAPPIIDLRTKLIQSAWDAIQLLRTKNTFLSLCFFSNARALFLKRLAGPPSYLEYAVGYPSLWSAVLSPLPASHQAACCQTNRPAHCHSLRIPNKVTQPATSIFQPDYLYHIDIGKVYVSSFHQLYWCFLRLSEILVGFKL